jgi:nucleotide-binding universal stress UspA family protein
VNFSALLDTDRFVATSLFPLLLLAIEEIMFQRALICTDFTDGMYRLAQFVPALAAGGLKSLMFFHNVPVETEREIPRIDPSQLDIPRQKLTNLLREVPDGVDVSVEVQMGRASDNILRLAKQFQADIIFLGTPTRTLLEEKLFGSTTVRITEKTDIPVLILRPQLISTYTTAELELRCNALFRYLLVPYDGSKGGQRLVEQLQQRVTNNPDSVLERVRLAWVIDDGLRQELIGEEASIQQAEEQLDVIQSQLAGLNLVVSTGVAEGDPLEEILKMAEIHDISAIATCSSGNGFLKWSTSSLTQEILRRSWHPVLFFPS